MGRERGAERESDRQREREKKRETDEKRESERERVTDGEREREGERERGTNYLTEALLAYIVQSVDKITKTKTGPSAVKQRQVITIIIMMIMDRSYIKQISS